MYVVSSSGRQDYSEQNKREGPEVGGRAAGHRDVHVHAGARVLDAAGPRRVRHVAPPKHVLRGRPSESLQPGEEKNDWLNDAGFIFKLFKKSKLFFSAKNKKYENIRE